MRVEIRLSLLRPNAIDLYVSALDGSVDRVASTPSVNQGYLVAGSMSVVSTYVVAVPLVTSNLTKVSCFATLLSMR